VRRDVDAASATATTHLGDRVGGEMAAIVGGVVSASVAVVAGTVAGGFGDVIGVAVLLGVLESGPLGWIVGALAGLLGTGVALWLGRDVLRDGIKAVRLPARVVKAATVSARRYERIIADGRTKCDAAVRRELERKLDPLARKIADEVWRRLMPVVGEQQRPHVGVDRD
jgi:hypothetical protein